MQGAAQNIESDFLNRALVLDGEDVSRSQLSPKDNARPSPIRSRAKDANIPL